MPTAHDSRSAKSISYVERLDAESRSLAKQLHELKFIYALYGILDGLSLSYSLLKYYFDIHCADSDFSSSDMMSDWMETTTGRTVAGTETVTLVAFALLANIFSDDDPDAAKRFIAIAWPYVRDILKAGKNGAKGARSALQALSMISGHNLQYLIVPAGVTLGVISALHRSWFRSCVKEPRLAMTKENAKIRLGIEGSCFYQLSAIPEVGLSAYKNSYILVRDRVYYITRHGLIEDVPIKDADRFFHNLRVLNPKNEDKFYVSYEETKILITDNGGYTSPIGGLDKDEADQYREQLKSQSEYLNDRLNTWALLGAMYGGLVDGLYLYMGALGLAVLSPPVFMAMTFCSTLYALACITTRVYEEYEFQRKFKSTQAKIELALCCKELEGLLETLIRVSDPFSQLSDEELGVLLAKVNGALTPDIIVEEGDLLNRQRNLTEAEELLRNLQTLSQGDDALEAHGTARSRFIEILKDLYLDESAFKMQQIKTKRTNLHSLVTLSETLAFFAGIRHGLAAYGAITSLMFAIATIDAIFLVPFSPAFLIAGVMTGMVCLVAFVIHAFVSNSPGVPDQPVELDEIMISPKRMGELDRNDKKLFALFVALKNPTTQLQSLPSEHVKEAVVEGMMVDSSPRYFFQEWFEVIRSFGSGLSKGPKLRDILESLLWFFLSDNDPDTPLLFRIVIIGAIFQALVFTFRAFARGLGRDDPEVVKPPSNLLFAPQPEEDEIIEVPSKGSESPLGGRRSGRSPLLECSTFANNKPSPIVSEPSTPVYSPTQ